MFTTILYAKSFVNTNISYCSDNIKHLVAINLHFRRQILTETKIVVGGRCKIRHKMQRLRNNALTKDSQ